MKIILSVIVLLATLATGRIHYCYPILGESGWKFCAKMAFGKGKTATWTHQLIPYTDEQKAFSAEVSVEVLIFKD